MGDTSFQSIPLAAEGLEELSEQTDLNGLGLDPNTVVVELLWDSASSSHEDMISNNRTQLFPEGLNEAQRVCSWHTEGGQETEACILFTDTLGGKIRSSW